MQESREFMKKTNEMNFCIMVIFSMKDHLCAVLWKSCIIGR